MKPGDKVVMNDNYHVSEANKRKVWTVASEPWDCCGTMVVKLEGKRWAAAIQTAGAVRDDDTVKGDFGASLYILTGLPSVYDRAQQHIHPGYIDFEPMFHMGLSSGETVLVALAGNLYNGGFFGGYTPQDIVSYCDTDGVALAARALALRKQRLDINTIYD